MAKKRIRNRRSRFVYENGEWWYVITPGNGTTPRRRTRAVEGECARCGARFLTVRHRVNLPGMCGKFCSRSCGSKARGGHKNKVGALSHRWRGGRNVVRGGYIEVYAPQHPAARGGTYVREHRLVMERILGRYLHPWEEVHHKNAKRDDNRPGNLELWIKSHPCGARVSDKLAELDGIAAQIARDFGRHGGPDKELELRISQSIRGWIGWNSHPIHDRAGDQQCPVPTTAK